MFSRHYFKICARNCFLRKMKPKTLKNLYKYMIYRIIEPFVQRACFQLSAKARSKSIFYSGLHLLCNDCFLQEAFFKTY